MSSFEDGSPFVRVEQRLESHPKLLSFSAACVEGHWSRLKDSKQNHEDIAQTHRKGRHDTKAWIAMLRDSGARHECRSLSENFAE